MYKFKRICFLLTDKTRNKFDNNYCNSNMSMKKNNRKNQKILSIKITTKKCFIKDLIDEPEYISYTEIIKLLFETEIFLHFKN